MHAWLRFATRALVIVALSAAGAPTAPSLARAGDEGRRAAPPFATFDAPGAPGDRGSLMTIAGDPDAAPTLNATKREKLARAGAAIDPARATGTIDPRQDAPWRIHDAASASPDGWMQPVHATFDPSLRTAVRAEAAADASRGLDASSFENVALMRREAREAGEAALARGTYDDNDACHYPRGSVLIMHIFVDHGGGTWSQEERDLAAAKADEAKDYYTTNTPFWWKANMQFDNYPTTGYWFNQVQVGYTIPDDPGGFDNFTKADMEHVLALMGVTDNDGDGWLRDDYGFGLQFWNGGWDNVITIFQPADVEGRPYASGGGFATICQFQDWSAQVWKHEWGHAFGAPDEYVEDGECANGTDCDVYGNPWLTEEVENGNCSLCSGSNCMMKNNQDTVCFWTRHFWARDDDDDNGQLDTVLRFEAPDQFPQVLEMWNGGAYGQNTTVDGFAAGVGQRAWAVFGLRSPADADYDLRMFLDNGHTYQMATSQYSGQTVDFIVADYNLNNLGNEHFRAERFSGSTSPYNIVWMQTAEEIYADGIVRGYTWNTNHVVQCWDVPLLAGEHVVFALENNGGNGDFGMALFRSAGQMYYANRSAALWTEDATGAGAGEYHTFDVPVDDVYGLVVWSNAPTNSAFTLKLGPSPVTLFDEAPFVSGLDLRLFRYDQVDPSWNVVAVRPDASDVELQLYDDANYTQLLAASDHYGGLEFVASRHEGPDDQYPRVTQVGGSGGYATEWDTGTDVSTGYVEGSWALDDVARVWDVDLESGVTYFFRQYHVPFITSLDAGVHLMSSGPLGGEPHQPKVNAIASADANPPSAGGEWFTYTTTRADSYGLVMAMNNEAEGAYTLWHGPRLYPQSEENVIVEGGVAFSSTVPVTTRWGVYGARPGRQSAIDISIFEEPSFGSLNGQSVGELDEVNFIAVDYDGAPLLDTEYHRYRRTSGVGSMQFEFEAGFENLIFEPGEETIYELSWGEGDVVKVFNLWIDGTFDLFQEVDVVVHDASGVMDLGAAMFATAGEQHLHLARAEADEIVDDRGTGESEIMHYYARFADWHGLVIFNNRADGGDYRIILREPSAVSTPEAPSLPVTAALAATSNPFRGRTLLRVDLPEPGRVSLRVHDVAGRLTRELPAAHLVAGSHDVVWDGRDGRGRRVDPGVYWVRLTTGREERVLKLVHLP